MARITSPGTFVFVNGAIIIDGWEVDCEGGDVPTQDEVTELIVKYIAGLLVDLPALQARLAAEKAMQSMRYVARKPDGDAA